MTSKPPTQMSQAIDHSENAACLLAIDRGPAALSGHLDRHGDSYHGRDGMGILVWIMKKYSKAPNKMLPRLNACLSKGVDPNGPAGARISPLMFALMIGCDCAADVLLTRGAEPNHRSPAGGAALNIVIDRISRRSYRHGPPYWQSIISMTQLLLVAGVDPNRPGRTGKHPLDAIIASISHIDQVIPMTRFLDLFWATGEVNWKDQWTDDVCKTARWGHLPEQARKKIAQAQAYRLAQRIKPDAPTLKPRAGLRL